METWQTIKIYIQRTAKFVISEITSIQDWLNNSLLFPEREDFQIRISIPNVIDFDELDIMLISDSAIILRDSLGEEPVETIMEMEAKERMEWIELMMTKLIHHYELNGINVELFVDDCFYSGFYDYTENTIHLNLRALLTNNTELVKDFLDTVFHELRHAIQWHAIDCYQKTEYRWVSNEEKIRTYISGFSNYIEARMDLEGYYYQFVEQESREFAATVLREAGLNR